MIIQKGTVKAIFNTRGLQLKPEAFGAIDRQVQILLERFATKAEAGGKKRLASNDILLVNGAQSPPVGASGAEAHDHTASGVSANITQDNPSRIKGPCSRCVNIHDRVLKIGRDLESQIAETAKLLYEEELRGTR